MSLLCKTLNLKKDKMKYGNYASEYKSRDIRYIR